MSKINIIQNAIKEMEGGSFQKLFDAYLFKKYNFKNIQTLGVQEGTNKTTKGTPDSFVVDEDEKYILIMYGTVIEKAFDKIKRDNVDFNEFIVLCRELHEKELIDLYADEAAKISDQSLGNYIIKHILIEKKIISISQLLQIGFPHYKNKLVYALNTLLQLFYSEDMMRYIVEQVNVS